MKQDCIRIQKMAHQLRRDVLNMGVRSGNKCHIGPSFSCAEIISALYFSFLDIKPDQPHWEDRDRFIISKGHAALIVYAALAHRGYFDSSELWNVKNTGSMLQGHPDMNKTPGIDMTSGSLGHGLSLGFGIAWGLRRQKKESKVVVLLGDGDSQEGLVWEAAMSIPAKKLNNVIAVLDYNHMQSSGSVDTILPMEPLVDKWKAFGWHVLEVAGHDVCQILEALNAAAHHDQRPSIIIAHTIKGKGVSFMEHNNAWHACHITEEEYRLAMEEIEIAENKLIEMI